MHEELEKRFFEFVRSEPSGGACALQSMYAVHERRRKALAHFLLVVCGCQYREDLFEQTVINAAAGGIDRRNRRAGLGFRWGKALRRERQGWWPHSSVPLDQLAVGKHQPDAKPHAQECDLRGC